MKDLVIRDLKISDIPAAMKLVLDEGWNQTEIGWKLFIDNPLNVCKCAIIDDKLVGTTTSYNFSNRVAWISMVLVDKSCRGHGISKVLMNSVLEDLKDVQAIKLDATEAGRPVYQKLGFVDEYLISRWIDTSFESEIDMIEDNIVPINESELKEVVEFDKQVFGAERPLIVSSWLYHFSDKCQVKKEGNQIMGFSLGRIGNRFHQIGPVSAKSTEDAIQLISKNLQNLKGKPIAIDVMDDKTGLTRWLEETGFVRKRSFTRMYLRNNPYPGNTHYQFVIGGPEFG